MDSGERTLGNGSEETLETFFLMAMMESFSFHAPNPLETADLLRQKPYARMLLDRYLSGERFLFETFTPG